MGLRVSMVLFLVLTKGSFNNGRLFLPYPSCLVFVTSRVIIGLGLSSFLMTSLIVVQEITHPRTRAAIAASWVGFLPFFVQHIPVPSD